MDGLPYPPAHAVAQTVAKHFRRHVELAGIPSEIPDASTIERLIIRCFGGWRMLRESFTAALALK